MRILAFQSGLHDASAAVFEDYRLIAAIQEERLRREKGWGDDVPWLAIDEVLRIAGWSRWDVDAIATNPGIFPLHYFSLLSAKRTLLHCAEGYWARALQPRHLACLHGERHGRCARVVFGPTDFCEKMRFGLIHSSFSPIIMRHMRLSALFHTDWNDALIYTADGIGDNISYSVRTLRDGRIHLPLWR